MKIKLNVRVNLTSSGQLFSVWPKFHSEAESAECRKTAKKMATVIGCKENAVRTQVCRIRQVLKEAI